MQRRRVTLEHGGEGKMNIGYPRRLPRSQARYNDGPSCLRTWCMRAGAPLAALLLPAHQRAGAARAPGGLQGLSARSAQFRSRGTRLRPDRWSRSGAGSKRGMIPTGSQSGRSACAGGALHCLARSSASHFFMPGESRSRANVWRRSIALAADSGSSTQRSSSSMASTLSGS